MPSGLPRVTFDLPAKPWWASRTLWFNGLALALAALESALQFMQPLVPVNVFLALAIVLPLVNMGLRMVTTKAVYK